MTIEIETEWYTPAGNLRNVPMFSATIENAYLRTSRIIRGADHTSVWQRASTQLAKWDEQERRQRAAAAKQNAVERGAAEAEELDSSAREAIAAVKTLLEYTLGVDDRINWDDLRDKRASSTFAFDEPPPLPPVVTPQVFAATFDPYPPRPWYISFWPGAESTWHERCAAVTLLNQSKAEQANAANYQEALRCEHVKAAHAAAAQAWNQRREAARQQHEAAVARFLEEQRNHNARVDGFRAAFENGVPAAVTEYLRGVFERSEYPDCFPVAHSVEFGPPGLASVAIDVPALSDFPMITGYAFVRSKCEAKPSFMKKREHADLYEQAVAQTVLRTLHEIFEADYVPVVHEAEVSAFVSYVDPATGKDQRDCKVAAAAKRGEFMALDLRRLDPVACVKSLSRPTMVSR